MHPIRRATIPRKKIIAEKTSFKRKRTKTKLRRRSIFPPYMNRFCLPSSRYPRVKLPLPRGWSWIWTADTFLLRPGVLFPRAADLRSQHMTEIPQTQKLSDMTPYMVLLPSRKVFMTVPALILHCSVRRAGSNKRFLLPIPTVLPMATRAFPSAQRHLQKT